MVTTVATTSKNGLMSATDKIKLDNVQLNNKTKTFEAWTDNNEVTITVTDGNNIKHILYITPNGLHYVKRNNGSDTWVWSNH